MTNLLVRTQTPPVVDLNASQASKPAGGNEHDSQPPRVIVATEPAALRNAGRTAKTGSRKSYAYLALGDCRLSVAHAERERAAVGEPVFIPGDGTDASFGRPDYSGFVTRAARAPSTERCAAVGGSIREHHARLGTVYHGGPDRGPRGRAGARAHGNAEDPHPHR